MPKNAVFPAISSKILIFNESYKGFFGAKGTEINFQNITRK